MFTVASRTALREWLIDLARGDPRITAAAILGSGADGTEDRWSDIDLALRLAVGDDPSTVANSWSVLLDDKAHPVAQMDLWSAGALYRVFLLPDTLQVDLSFWPHDRFAPHGPKFWLVFGNANEPADSAAASPRASLSRAWLYALHGRSSIARGRGWQAVHMTNGVRDQVIELACQRFGLPPSQGRGVDDLPDDVTAALEATLPRSLLSVELQRAFGEAVKLLVAEARHLDPEGFGQLEEVLHELVWTAGSDAE